MSGRRRWGERPFPELSPDERLIWQGAPCWRAVARRVFRVPVVAAYFTVLTLVNMAIIRLHEGSGWLAVEGAMPTVLGGGACVLILGSLAWWTGRTTRYVVTTRRVVLQFGLALPVTLVLPLHQVTASAVRVHRDHSGDITLGVPPGTALTYAKLWPHVRPWRFGRPEPMLRDVPRVATVAPLLARALAAAAEAARAARQEVPLRRAS